MAAKTITVDSEALAQFLAVYDILDDFLGPGAGDVWDELDVEFPRHQEALDVLRAA